MKNPFTCRGRIEDPNLFWGRSEEIRDIKTRLATMQNVSVVGERRIGKSSLLYYFFKKGKELLGDLYTLPWKTPETVAWAIFLTAFSRGWKAWKG